MKGEVLVSVPREVRDRCAGQDDPSYVVLSDRIAINEACKRSALSESSGVKLTGEAHDLLDGDAYDAYLQKLPDGPVDIYITPSTPRGEDS